MSNYTKSTNFATKDNLTPGDPLKIVRGTEIDTEFNNIATAIATKTDNASAAITGGSITGITDLAIADGGTGASTATAAINNLLPSQTSNANKYLQTDGTNVSWDAVSLSTSDITGTLPVANGGTGVTSSTGTGSVVLSNSPTLVTPALGTPASGVATNLTGLPLSTGVTGTLPIANGGTGQTTANAAFNALAPSQATASGKYLKSDGTNTSWDALDISTADITGTLPVANGGTGVTTSTGTGSVVLSNSPTLVTPALGTPSSATLTNATGLPISTGVSGLGTGVATALAVNVGSAGAPVVNGGALGTPSSGTVTNLTGTASININGTVGATTPTTGAFTTTTVSTSETLSYGTANGVTYLNGSKVLTSGSALTFDGTNLNLGVNGATIYWTAAGNNVAINTSSGVLGFYTGTSSYGLAQQINADGTTLWKVGGSEQMRLTSTGLGIGTSSPATKLEVTGDIGGTWTAGATRFVGSQYLTGSAYQLGMKTTMDTRETQIFAKAADTGGYVTIATGTTPTERVRVDGSGNVGIGTSSLSEKFTVQSTGNSIGSFQSSGASYVGVQAYNSSQSFSMLVRPDVSNALVFRNETTSTNQLTLTTAGNLGLGVTPSAWGASWKGFELGALGSSIFGQTAGNNTYITANAFFNGTNWIRPYAATATAYNQTGGVHSWLTAGSSTAGSTISFTQAMTLDASGNLGVGTTSPSGRLDVIATNAGGTTYSYFQNNGASGVSASGIAFAQSGSIKSSIVAAVYGNDYMTFNVGSNTERARIDSSGNLLVGTTSGGGRKLEVVTSGTNHAISGLSDTAGYATFECINSAASGTRNFIGFRSSRGGADVGSITYNGTLTAYNATSDYRLKTVHGAVTGHGERIDALEPVEYTWNSNGTRTRGFLAHKFQEVYADSVTGEKDAVDADGNPVYQAMQASTPEVIADLVAEIQSLRQRVAQLETN